MTFINGTCFFYFERLELKENGKCLTSRVNEDLQDCCLLDKISVDPYHQDVTKALIGLNGHVILLRFPVDGHESRNIQIDLHVQVPGRAVEGMVVSRQGKKHPDRVEGMLVSI